MASEKITAIIDSVKELSVLELKELIDTYCEEFGVSAVAAAAPAAAGAAASAEEEKTEFDLPGQYDQRGDSAEQCVQLLTQGERCKVL